MKNLVLKIFYVSPTKQFGPKFILFQKNHRAFFGQAFFPLNIELNIEIGWISYTPLGSMPSSYAPYFYTQKKILKSLA